MILASRPVASLRRLAARPVGAHSSTRMRLARSAWRMLVTIVVLPTPGPPVMTVTLPVSTWATAARCEAARVRPVRSSTQGITFAGGALGADAVEFLQTLWGLRDDVEDLGTEGLHQFAGKVRANAFDHAGTQVLLDAFERRGGTTRSCVVLNCKPCVV